MPEFLQKTYNCVLRFKGGLLHTVNLHGVTKHELQLLAFMHGVEAIAELKAMGAERVVSHVDHEANPPVTHYVEDEMGEYRRLARKYDTIVNAGRGKKNVEECFKVVLTDFDNILQEVNALGEIERKAAEAEAAAALRVGGDEYNKREEALAKATAATETVGARFQAAVRQPM